MMQREDGLRMIKEAIVNAEFRDFRDPTAWGEDNVLMILKFDTRSIEGMSRAGFGEALRSEMRRAIEALEADDNVDISAADVQEAREIKQALGVMKKYLS